MNSFYSQDELKNLGLSKYGDNVLISKKASLYGVENIEIGNNVRVDDFCILSGKIKIGDNIHISAYSALYGGKTGILLEDFATVSSRCVVYAESDDYLGEVLTNSTIPSKYRNVIQGKVEFKKHSIIGSGCTVLPGVTLHEGAAVGCMSLVNRTLEEWSVYVGIPCKKIKDRSKNLLQLEKMMINDK